MYGWQRNDTRQQKEATNCAGRVLANTRLHPLRWGEEEVPSCLMQERQSHGSFSNWTVLIFWIMQSLASHTRLSATADQFINWTLQQHSTSLWSAVLASIQQGRALECALVGLNSMGMLATPTRNIHQKPPKYGRLYNPDMQWWSHDVCNRGVPPAVCHMGLGLNLVCQATFVMWFTGSGFQSTLGAFTQSSSFLLCMHVVHTILNTISVLINVHQGDVSKARAQLSSPGCQCHQCSNKKVPFYKKSTLESLQKLFSLQTTHPCSLQYINDDICPQIENIWYVQISWGFLYLNGTITKL